MARRDQRDTMEVYVAVNTYSVSVVEQCTRVILLPVFSWQVSLAQGEPMLRTPFTMEPPEKNTNFDRDGSWSGAISDKLRHC